MRLGRWMALLTRFSTFAITAAIFLLPASWAGDEYKVLHSFGKGKDGAGVFAGVALDNEGNLYGATTGGGAYGHGTAFQLTPGSGGEWTETILHSFCAISRCKDGSSPSGVLVLDSKGNLYGASNVATFEIKRKAGGWTFLVICDCIAPSVFDAVGNLYGIGGPGTHQAGAVAELSPSADGWKETLLHSFAPGLPIVATASRRSGVSVGMLLGICTALRSSAATTVRRSATPTAEWFTSYRRWAEGSGNITGFTALLPPRTTGSCLSTA